MTRYIALSLVTPHEPLAQSPGVGLRPGFFEQLLESALDGFALAHLVRYAILLELLLNAQR